MRHGLQVTEPHFTVDDADQIASHPLARRKGKLWLLLLLSALLHSQVLHTTVTAQRKRFQLTTKEHLIIETE
jgi:hypothetical protein